MRHKQLILVAAVLPILSGCHAIFGGKQSHNSHLPENQSPEIFAATQLELGRVALDKRHYAFAISAFRKARFAPGQSADALNGMAVAYARIGRPDLAERYFSEAIAIAPEDQRFRGNLARLRREAAAKDAYLAAQQAEEAIRQAKLAENYPVRVTFPNRAQLAVKAEANLENFGGMGRGLLIQNADVALTGVAEKVAVSVEKPEDKATLSYPIRVSFSSQAGTGKNGYPIRVDLTKASE